jgi:hypothetical protein
MKPFSILGKAVRTISLLALSMGLTIGLGGTVHAEEGKQTEYAKDRTPCAGPQGLECPAGLTCADDPADECNPMQDGPDCPGICVAGTPMGVKHPCAGPNHLKCPGGFECVDDTTDDCDPREEGAECMGFCTAGAPVGVKSPCGGPSQIECPGDMACVDDPTDDCDPTQDGVKCMGFCAVPSSESTIIGPRSVR